MGSPRTRVMAFNTQPVEGSQLQDVHVVVLSAAYGIHRRMGLYYVDAPLSELDGTPATPVKVYVPSLLFTSIYEVYRKDKHYRHRSAWMCFLPTALSEVTESTQCYLPLLPNVHSSARICTGDMLKRKRTGKEMLSSIELPEVVHHQLRDLHTLFASPWNADVARAAALTSVMRQAGLLQAEEGNVATAVLLLDAMTPLETIEVLRSSAPIGSVHTLVGHALREQQQVVTELRVGKSTFGRGGFATANLNVIDDND